jgi:NADH:ubiquinone oxidoreductase subunit H
MGPPPPSDRLGSAAFRPHLELSQAAVAWCDEMLYSIFASALLIPTLALLVVSLLSLFLERKLIGIAQKRLGISFLGRNGWAHLPADLVKF